MIHCFISIDIYQVEDIIDIVDCRLLSSDQIHQYFYNVGELAPSEALVLVAVELAEDLLEEVRDVLFLEGAIDC